MARIHKHTSLVKTLGYNPHCVEFHFTALSTLKRVLCLSGPLFPGLEEAHIPAISDEPMNTIFYSSLILNSTIRQVVIHVDPSEARAGSPEDLEELGWTSLSDRLAEQSPNLEALTIHQGQAMFRMYGPSKIPTIGPKFPLIAVLPAFKGTLRALDVSLFELPATAFQFLGELSSLRNLKITLHCGTEDSYSANQPTQRPTLHSLTTLSIITDSSWVCEQAAQLFSAPILETLAVDVALEEHDEPFELQGLFMALFQSGSHHRLSTIVFRQVIFDFDREEEEFDRWKRAMKCKDDFHFVINDQVLGTLASSPLLTRVDIHPCDTSDVTDEGLVGLAIGCTTLQYLDLRHDTMASDAPPALTFSGLHNALQAATCLQHLSIRFDATSVPGELVEVVTDPTRPAHDGQVLSSLRYLDVCTSPIQSPSFLTSWLACFHPHLSQLVSYRHFNFAYDEVYNWERWSAEKKLRKVVEGHVYAATMMDRWDEVALFVKRRGVSDGSAT